MAVQQPPVRLAEPPTPATVPVLYQDADQLVLNKAAGLRVHPSSRYLLGTVVGRLRQRFGARYAAPVHRLDRETSGVLVCARTRAAARALSRSLAARAWAKVYLAVCEGDMPQPQMTVHAPLSQVCVKKIAAAPNFGHSPSGYVDTSVRGPYSQLSLKLFSRRFNRARLP